jgi:hypothetical protein
MAGLLEKMLLNFLDQNSSRNQPKFRQRNQVLPPCRPVSNLFSHKKWDLAKFSTEEGIRRPLLSILATPWLQLDASCPSFLGSFSSIKLVLDVSTSYGCERFPISL